MSSPPTMIRTFSEREFYLTEFRGRSIGIAWPAEEPPVAKPLAGVIAELVANDSRVVLMTPHVSLCEMVGVAPSAGAGEERYAARLWRDLRLTGTAALDVPARNFEQACARAALEMRLAKVVWIASDAPLERVGESGRVSVVDLAHLEPLLAREATRSNRAGDDGEARSPLRVAAGASARLEAIRDMIEGGIPSVNVCTHEDLVRELFTYEGAGIFFTRDRYAEVRPLALDDFDLANDLIERGEADGFLAPRDLAARENVLSHGVGVFIEGRYLAGIGAILPYPSAAAAELACLFALTRYVGEGAGAQIVAYAAERAASEGLEYLFSCTTSESVVRFFERNGFREVSEGDVPPEKWEGYAVDRRGRVRCLRRDVA